jgi:hypothetical protein
VPETTAEPQPLSVVSPVIATRLASVRNRTGRVALETGIAMAVPALIAWLAVVMPLDWLVGLPRWARALFLLAGVGGAGFVLFWFGIRRWMNKPDNDRTALSIERALPEFRSRFIASVQLARQNENTPPALVRALLKETEALTRQVDFQRVVKTDKLRLWLKIGAAAFVFAVVLWLYGGRKLAAFPTRVPCRSSAAAQNANHRFQRRTRDRSWRRCAHRGKCRRHRPGRWKAVAAHRGRQKTGIHLRCRPAEQGALFPQPAKCAGDL